MGANQMGQLGINIPLMILQKIQEASCAIADAMVSCQIARIRNVKTQD